jgi:prevent-host-death family protein
MSEIGVREMKIHAAEIVRNVREHRARYVVTYRGKPVGLLTPLESLTTTPMSETTGGPDAWEELVRLGKEIGDRWRSPQTSVEVLSEMRR